jgi:hypothetical protein
MFLRLTQGALPADRACARETGEDGGQMSLRVTALAARRGVSQGDGTVLVGRRLGKILQSRPGSVARSRDLS